MLMTICLIFCLCISLYSSESSNNEFYAYYTKLPDDYPSLNQYQDSLFGRYADVIVQVGNNGQFIFSRETSYLPQWKTASGTWIFEELVERSGDGDKKRPDVLPRYSHVRIIEQSDSQITIHWRYFPDFDNVNWADVVDEYFYIKPDGIINRTIHKGTNGTDDWNSKTGLVNQRIKLKSTGIEYLDTREEPSQQKSPQLSGKPNFNKVDKNLMLQFKFNEIHNNSTIETVTGQAYDIKGPKTLLKNGISTNTLNMDGYYSGIVVDDFKSDKPVQVKIIF